MLERDGYRTDMHKMAHFCAIAIHIAENFWRELKSIRKNELRQAIYNNHFPAHDAREALEETVMSRASQPSRK